MACEKEASNVLSSGKMEDVLYDYHIAQAMIDKLGYEDREKMAQAYVDAVFEKHHITEAEFDSSLIYYNRHAEELNEIYKSLKERLDDDNNQISLATGNEVMAVYSANGDTANIWNGAKLMVLRCKEGLNYETFTFNADSSFHRKDKFLLLCNTNIISENNSGPDNYVNLGLTVTYKDGTSTSSTMRSTTSRDMQMTVNAFEDKDISKVSGFFYYNGNKTLRNIAFISNIGLVRMRTVKEAPKAEDNDSTGIDSLNMFAPTKHQQHLSPEEMRKKNQSDTHIKIKAAPDVRTPNSTFTRRRPARR